MKLAFVLPRYGAEILGGAEQAARVLAESIVRRSGWSVEVFTTCAADSSTFTDAYPSGTTIESGVRVHRFPATGRARDFDVLSNEILFGPRASRIRRGDEWVRAQGPVSEELIAALAHTDAELVAFHPYLYFPTVFGVRVASDRPILLHPAVHDEPPLSLPVFDGVFGAADGVVFWTRSEQALANRRFRIGATPQLVLGVGVERQAGAPDAARAAVGLGGEPFALCLGRIDISKGVKLLAEFFATYKEHCPGPERLVFAGPVRHGLPEHPDIIVAGPVEEDVKWGLLAAADVLISPSALESFSIVLLESWLAGTPVLVNGACQPTVDHVRDSNGGLWFNGYSEFELALSRLFEDPALRSEMARSGRTYTETHYQLEALTDRYMDFCARVVASWREGAGRAASRATRSVR